MVDSAVLQQGWTAGGGLRRAWQPLLLAMVYCLAALVSLQLMRHADGVAIVWLPNAIAIGVILRAPRAAWPALFGAVAAGSLAASLTTTSEPLRLLGLLSANLAEVGLAVLGTRLLLRQPVTLASVQELACLVLAAAVLAPLCGGVLGALVWAPGTDEFFAALLSWWAAEAIGVVLIVPAILTWPVGWLARERPAAGLAEFTAVAAAAAVVQIVMYSLTGAISLFLLAPALLWTGLRLGRLESAIAGQIFAALAIWLAGIGKLVLLPTWTMNQAHVALLQAFIASSALLALTVAVLDHVRERERRRLAQSQATLAEISERMPGVVYRYRLTPEGHGGFDFISGSANRLYGLDVAAATEDPTVVFRDIDDEDRERMRRSVAQSAAALTPWREEFRVRLAGGPRWIRSEAVPHRAADGSTVWNGMQIDVTEAKLREQELAAAEHRQRRIMDAMHDGVVLVDEHGVIASANPAVCRSFGYTDDELIGRNMRLLLAEPDRARHDGFLANDRPASIGEVIGNGREMTGLRKDGTVFPLDLSMAAFRQADGSRGFIGTLHDLTERRRTEDQLRHAQKLEAVGQLTGGMAHDFNNMLAVIQGNLELILERAQDQPELRRFGDAALRAAGRGAELTRRLLAFSRRQSLAPVATDVNALIRGVDDMLQSALGGAITRRLELGVQLTPVIVDRSELENALLNLAVNARDAMPGGGTLTLATDRVRLTHTDDTDAPPPGDYLRIRVSDTGHGMPAEIAARAFEPFFTTKPVGRGSGMGLSMVYGFVRQSGGQARIDSVAGVGTTVSILLPFSTDDAADAPLPGQGRHVLLVDPEPDSMAQATTLLYGLGYEVVAARDGHAALARLDDAEIDVVLTAVTLPHGLDGRQIAEAARRRRVPVPVLYMSARLDAALDEGVGLLPKPFGRGELAAALARALSAAPPRS